MRDVVLTGGNALPEDDPPDVTRFKAAAAKRVQAHRRRKSMGLRCLTVWVNDRIVRHLISTGYLSLGSSGMAAYVACALRPGCCRIRARGRESTDWSISARWSRKPLAYHGARPVLCTQNWTYQLTK
jgi:hypothetical protein